jgi:hypothetical protein
MSTIDKIFKEKLEGLEKTPPPSAWGKVSSNLNNENSKAFYFWYTAAACLIILLMTVFITLDFKSKSGSIAQSNNVEFKKIEKKPVHLSKTISEGLPELKALSHKKEIKVLPGRAIKKEELNNSFTRRNKRMEKKEKADGIFDESAISDSEIAALNNEEIVFNPDEELAEKEMPELINTVQPIEVIIKKSKVSTPVDTSQRSKNKWGKAFQQVVNLKNGEKVNFREFSKLLATNKKDNENSK